MKKELLLVMVFFLFITSLTQAAEVSEKKDMAIFGLTYGSYGIPDEVLYYIDSSINNVFINLKRFNVLGYGDYRLESKDVDEFVKRIREIRAEKAKEAGTFDEKFGTVVIRGEDFDRIVNSFLVVIPSLSSYNVSTEKKYITWEDTVYVVRTNVVRMVVDLTFVNIREGTQEESIRMSGTGRDENINMAERKAVDDALSGLTLRIRELESFKIKSGVFKVQGDTVYFELGSGIGMKPGDEFQVMTKEQVGKTGKTLEVPTGLVRAKKVYPDFTEARIVYQGEKITEGDQLVEVVKIGVQTSIHAGVMKLDIPDMDYNIFLVDDSDVGNTSVTDFYYFGLNQDDSGFAPLVGVSVGYSLGYRLNGILDGTAILNFPLFGVIGELGIGSYFHARRFSLRLSASGGVVYMTTFNKELEREGVKDSLIIEGTRIDIDDDPVIKFGGISVGAKGGAVVEYRIKTNLSLRLGINYRVYTSIDDWEVEIEETSGSNKETVTIDSDSSNIAEIFGSEGLKRVELSGYEFNFAFTFRF
jgi:hypothetical protein